MDRRIRKTKEAIREAFFALLLKKGNIENITIQDIISEADISRSTFYSHYTGLYEMINEVAVIYADRIFEVIKATHESNQGADLYKNIYVEIFTYLNTYNKIAHILFLDSNQVFIDKIAYDVEAKLADYYCEKYPEINPDVLSASAIFATGGCYSLIKHWAKSGFKEDPHTMATRLANAIKTSADFFFSETAN